jgi:hypothetical protein
MTRSFNRMTRSFNRMTRSCNRMTRSCNRIIRSVDRMSHPVDRMDCRGSVLMCPGLLPARNWTAANGRGTRPVIHCSSLSVTGAIRGRVIITRSLLWGNKAV